MTTECANLPTGVDDVAVREETLEYCQSVAADQERLLETAVGKCSEECRVQVDVAGYDDSGARGKGIASVATAMVMAMATTTLLIGALGAE
mmetsp:Transcript_7564/g.16099  ORF Transcript_7564/g.16099 Transcript_7564/m.16099 type:complete len:91 (+) Transcript_7564:12-284(+)